MTSMMRVDPTMSVFSDRSKVMFKDPHGAFMKSVLVSGEEVDGILVSADINKYRRMIFHFYQSDCPVFRIIDEIMQADRPGEDRRMRVLVRGYRGCTNSRE